ncbi:phosphatase 2C-like domain-containing protein [Naematelia encephala]|uniref:Phosphatase 2C-like domain-containing protein n=1 Tax=Naematelia encephala TaxID=71784 RepID=A0A1Y2AUQ7_9TREE|nr:phosphatase 2C-like domain-containing protein [Naematelia encephala]
MSVLTRARSILGATGGPCSSRRIHDFIRGTTDTGTYKVPLSSPKIVGVCQSRGDRLYQEDRTAVHALQISPKEISLSLSKLKEPPSWDSSKSGSEFLASQVAFFGIYDGHGGKEVSSYISSHLHELVESVEPSTVESLVSWTRARHGGYFKRWRGGALQKWTKWGQSSSEERERMTLEERLTLAFVEADKAILTGIESAQRCGSTGTVVLLHSLDEPTQPYWSSEKLYLTVGHCGDTRALLCHRPTGKVETLTERHHAEARVEATRLRRMGADRLVADSFGESRWMGVVENTRGFGDGEWKPSGVTPEPEVVSKILNGQDYSYLVLVTDGLTSLMSDQEIIDLARNASDPTRAAKAIVHFGEDLGAQDNCSCIVVPLRGWGHVGGRDDTEARREYRKKQVGALNTRMQRM